MAGATFQDHAAIHRDGVPGELEMSASEGCPPKDQAGDYGNTSKTLQGCTMAKPFCKNPSLHLLEG